MGETNIELAQIFNSHLYHGKKNVLSIVSSIYIV